MKTTFAAFAAAVTCLLQPAAATTGANAQSTTSMSTCNNATVTRYRSVTETVTTSIFLPPSTCPSLTVDSPTSSASSSYYTVTATSTLTAYVTVPAPAAASQSLATVAPADLSYGTSSSMTTVTVTETIIPVASLTTSSSIGAATLTGTLAPFTSTTLSYNPATTVTTHITYTSTLSLVSTVYATSSPVGWNGTAVRVTTSAALSAAALGTSASTSTDAPSSTPTTLTATYYWVNGNLTTSTSTSTITTTLTGTLASTVTATISPVTSSVFLSSANSTMPAAVTIIASTFATTIPAAGASSSTLAPGSSVAGALSGSVSLSTSSSTETGGVIPTSSASGTVSVASSLVSAAALSSTIAVTQTVPYMTNSVQTYTVTMGSSTTTVIVTASVSGTALPLVPTSLSSYGYATPNSSVSAVATSGAATSSAASSQSTTSTLSSTIPSTQALPTNGTLSTATASSATATPSMCGDNGPFMLNFDDLPNFSTRNGTDITQAPPIFNPYHHLTFSNGYVYAPLPNDPFVPESPPHLAVFLGNASGNGNTSIPSAMSPSFTSIRPGEFGDGSLENNPVWWFNASSAFLGCGGASTCDMVITGYSWDQATRSEVEKYSYNATLPPCNQPSGCRLQQVIFPDNSTGLTGMQIQAYSQGQETMFFMDNVQMGWYNTTCAAGMQRTQSPFGNSAAAPSAGSSKMRARRVRY